jgi:hypothetical protein
VTQSERANGFLVEPVISHNLLSEACLRCLIDHLHYDMASLHRPGTRFPGSNSEGFGKPNWALRHEDTGMERRLFDATRYAAKHWTRHVSQSLGENNLTELLERFLRHKLLNWMEFLSLLSHIRQGIESIHELYQTLQSLQKRTSSHWVSQKLIHIE